MPGETFSQISCLTSRQPTNTSTSFLLCKPPNAVCFFSIKPTLKSTVRTMTAAIIIISIELTRLMCRYRFLKCKLQNRSKDKDKDPNVNNTRYCYNSVIYPRRLTRNTWLGAGGKMEQTEKFTAMMGGPCRYPSVKDDGFLPDSFRDLSWAVRL